LAAENAMIRVDVQVFLVLFLDLFVGLNGVLVALFHVGDEVEVEPPLMLPQLVLGVVLAFLLLLLHVAVFLVFIVLVLLVVGGLFRVQVQELRHLGPLFVLFIF